MNSNQQKYKNLTCLAFCFVIFFVTSIFVSQTYYERIINDQIADVSLLKSTTYQDWGLMKVPSSIFHQFQAYDYDIKTKQSKLINQTVKYEYTYEYKNISFSQGNTGNVQYLNEWKRSFIPSQNVTNQQYNIFNIDAEKVYNYDFYAPETRNFALMYNVLFNTLSKDFVEYFYGYYIYEYFFKNITNVQKRIFEPLKISYQDGIKIYNNQNYGFNKPQTIARWLKLNQRISQQTHYFDNFYTDIQQNLLLSQKQILFIADQSSTLSNLVIALKGSIKYKLWSRDYSYECEDDFCTGQVLAASQLAFGFLTKQSIFPSINLDKLTHQLNTTIYDGIQYMPFCQNTDNVTCLDLEATIQFFMENHLANYTEVDFILKNLDKPEIIQDKYQFPENTGQSICLYVKHLYNNIFNIPSTISENDNKQPFLALKKSFTNYNHIQRILDSSKDLLYLQLHSRAFFNKFINNNSKVKCQDYFTGQFQQYKQDCYQQQLNLTTGLLSIRTYFSAYLGLSSQQLTNISSMQPSMIYKFLHNEQQSLLARQIDQVIKIIKKQYNCVEYCSSQELMVKQWKNGAVLMNLPEEYFNNITNVSILDWDDQNILKHTQPQIYKYINLNKSSLLYQQLHPSQIFNDLSGIYSIFNLMRIYNDPDFNIYSGISNSDLLMYIQSIVLSIDFDGLYYKKGLKNIFNGYQSKIIQYKNNMDVKLGGASWMNKKISMIQLQNKPTKFNAINSGIYNSQKLRSFKYIEDNQYSSSEYVIFKTQDEDLRITFNTNKKVKGTNLLGFQTKIKQFDTIQGYFDMIHQSETLTYKQSIKWKDSTGKQISAYKFQFSSVSNQYVPIDIQQQSNRTVLMTPQSFIIVQPLSGMTLQLYIKYKVFTSPFFLQSLFPSSNNNNNNRIPLYQGEIFYYNSNTQKILSINDNTNQLDLLFWVSMILGTISWVVFLVFVVMWVRSRSGRKMLREEEKSLITEANNVSSAVSY